MWIGFAVTKENQQSVVIHWLAKESVLPCLRAKSPPELVQLLILMHLHNWLWEVGLWRVPGERRRGRLARRGAA